MKLPHLFTSIFFLAALFFAGCASTPDASVSEERSGADGEVRDDTPELTRDSGLLMDQYRSGRIPGYRE